jgi:hypothetical protein
MILAGRFTRDIAGEKPTSCGAAIRVKPKARLWEPWVTSSQMIEPQRGDTKFVSRVLR